VCSATFQEGWRKVPSLEPFELPEGLVAMADKSPKKSSGKTVAAKSLKEKRADKKAKSATKKTD
jgi:hypothetical protein